MKKFLHKLWEGWKKFAHRLGRIQTIVIITIFYFIAIVPLGGIFRLFGWDPLNYKGFGVNRSTNWRAVKEKSPDIQSLRRQS